VDGFVRVLLFLLLFFAQLLSAHSALAIEPLAQPTDKQKIGQGVTDFKESAGSAARTVCYFMAGLLLAFGVWKKINDKKNSGQPKLISIVSRTQLSAKAGLLIAEVEGERFLLSQTPDQISFITKLNTNGFDNILEEELSDEKA
jgi:flagellar biogenesis protein FliO